MITQTFQVQNTTIIGRFGEKLALNYLVKKGYKLLDQNYHIRGGELDLVLEKDDIITFVEVKLRTGGNFGTGMDAVTQTKKRKLLRTIFTFLQTKNIQKPWQLDLVSIDYRRTTGTAYIQHFPNILES